MDDVVSAFNDWFRVGLLGPYIATPKHALGWIATLGLTLPALVYAVLGGCLGRLLAVGLLAFLFGFSYAIAGEGRVVGSGRTDADLRSNGPSPKPSGVVKAGLAR